MQLPAKACQSALSSTILDRLGKLDTLLAELGDQVQQDDVDLGRYRLAVQQANQRRVYQVLSSSAWTAADGTYFEGLVPHDVLIASEKSCMEQLPVD